MAFGVEADRKILRQLQGRFFTVQPKEAGSEINHIPILLTAETVKPSVRLHAEMFIIVERTVGHPVPVH